MLNMVKGKSQTAVQYCVATAAMAENVIKPFAGLSDKRVDWP
jgi:hypothetical protein